MIESKMDRVSNRPMKIVEVARFVENVPQATEFYAKLLGVEPVHADSSIAILKHEGVTYLIHARYVPAPHELPCEDHLAFGVSNVDETVQTLVQQGLSVAYPPRDYDWGRSAYLREPGGSLIEIAQVRDTNEE